MMLFRLCLTLIWIILTTSSFSLGASHPSAVISPDLQQAMQAAGPAGHVSVIINLADKADLTLIAPAASLRRTPDEKKNRRDRIVKALQEKASDTQGPLLAFLHARGAQRVKTLWVTNAIAAILPVSVISELMNFSSIESIEPDEVLQPEPLLPAADAIPGWNINRVNVPSLWNAGIKGAGVVVANLDTGVDGTHPDLASKWRGGACEAPPNCDSWFDPYTNSTQPYDLAGLLYTGHGTGTMGIMVGGSATDAYGVSPEAKWIAAKIFNNAGNADLSNVILALEWLLAPGGNTANTPDIVNNSWGFDSLGCIPDTALQTAIQNVLAAGIAIVFSAGNKGPGASTSTSPANYKDLFAVGATDFSDTIAYTSSRGPSSCIDRTTNFPNVVAPGINIYTSAPSAAYQIVTGTSFSTPHAAGAMALLVSAFPSLTPVEMEIALEQASVPLPPAGMSPNNDYGFGLLDVGGALSFFTTHGYIVLPEITGYPASFDYSTVEINSTSPQTFTITNKTGGSITINSVTITGVNALEFTLSGNTCTGTTLAPSESCSFTVSVAPVSTGVKTASISISYGEPAAVYFVPLTCSATGPIVRVQGTTLVAWYSSIQTAYDECGSGDLIKMQVATFSENINFNNLSDIAVSLLGGYDAAFDTQTGFTTVQGALTISRGSVIAGNLVLR